MKSLVMTVDLTLTLTLSQNQLFFLNIYIYFSTTDVKLTQFGDLPDPNGTIKPPKSNSKLMINALDNPIELFL